MGRAPQDERGGAWQGTVTPLVAGRTEKPRSFGVTMIIDKGLGPQATEDLLALSSPSIDFIKLAFGTSAIYPPRVLAEKIGIIRSFGVDVYPGGTLLELAGVQGRAGDFIRRAADLGFTAVEISEGAVEIDGEERLDRVSLARSLGLRVVTEVGKKDPKAPLDPEAIVRQVRRDREHGAEFVIVEGRDSGVGVGVYDDDGRPREETIDAVLAGVDDPAVLMWEAPIIRQQQYWILRLGPNVNLGNVQPHDAMTLEATRMALRGDTLRTRLVEAGRDVSHF